MTSNHKFSRRRALGLGLGIVAAPAIPRSQARAEGGRVVVGTWGGDYARLLAKNIEDPILKPKGFDVAQDQANDGPRRTKLVAEKRLPRGTTDIQGSITTYSGPASTAPEPSSLILSICSLAVLGLAGRKRQ